MVQRHLGGKQPCWAEAFKLAFSKPRFHAGVSSSKTQGSWTQVLDLKLDAGGLLKAEGVTRGSSVSCLYLLAIEVICKTMGVIVRKNNSEAMGTG